MATVSAEEIKMKIEDLRSLITTAHPRLPVLLQEIHKVLKADAENVTLLSEEDISVIVNGLKAQTKTEITASTLKKKTSLKGVTLADL